MTAALDDRGGDSRVTSRIGIDTAARTYRPGEDLFAVIAGEIEALVRIGMSPHDALGAASWRAGPSLGATSASLPSVAAPTPPSSPAASVSASGSTPRRRRDARLAALSTRSCSRVHLDWADRPQLGRTAAA